MPAASTALPPIDRIPDALERNDISTYNNIGLFDNLYSPSHNARHEIAKVIHSCAGDHEKLSLLGQIFIHYLIRPFKKFKGRTPAPSDYPSRSSFDELKRYIRPRIESAPKTHKDLALLRDGFRCIVTGSCDGNALAEVPVLPQDASMVYIDCAHIVPESTYFDVSDKDPENRKLDYAASVLAVLKCFGYAIEQLNGEKVHSLFNVMNGWFDRLEIWFEKTKVANCYNIRAVSRYHRLPKGPVTFTTPDSENLPVPSAELLALHAACARVARLSGATEHIDTADRDVERSGVLAYDGSSGEVLSSALVNQTIGVGI